MRMAAVEHVAGHAWARSAGGRQHRCNELDCAGRAGHSSMTPRRVGLGVVVIASSATHARTGSAGEDRNTTRVERRHAATGRHRLGGRRPCFGSAADRARMVRQRSSRRSARNENPRARSNTTFASKSFWIAREESFTSMLGRDVL
jgi:hypothetical protein